MSTPLSGSRAEEIFHTVMVALCFAVPTAWIAFGIQKVGWQLAPVLALPPLCAFFAGRWTSQDKWMKEFEARAAALEAKLNDHQRRGK